MFIVRWLLRTLKWLVFFFFASTILAVVAYRFIPVPLTPLMLIRCVEQYKSGQEVKLHHDWEPLENISPHLPVAVMASEDQLFLKHNGFDTKAIKNAYENNKKRKKKLGGSTITQQTAKNVFLWHGRNYVRKGLEAYFTVLMELFWSKQRIMEVYLNSIEMGNGIYGAEAVAQHHFGKSAASLSRSECALIAATLPNPLKRNSQYPTPYLKKRQRQIEHQMKFIPTFPKEGESINPKTTTGGVYHQ